MGTHQARSPGRPGGERVLTLDQIVTAALELLDRHGPAGLSMRRLADTLGVSPNALYTYVADRAVLEQAVVDRLLRLADIALLDGPRERWRARLIAFAQSLRSVLRQHPGAMGFFMSAPLTTEANLDVGEAMLRCFTDAGLTLEDASRATYLASLYVLGYLAFDIAETDAVPPLPDDRQRAERRAALLAYIDVDRYPLTAASSGTAATWIGDETYEWGLHRLLDGLIGVTAGRRFTRPE